MVTYAFEMLKRDGSEMEHRNVVNRAYYGAFLVARDSAGITNVGGSVHKDVEVHYRRKHMTRISNNLDKLKRWRHIADYEPHQDVTYHRANNSCRTARNILKQLVESNA